MMEITGNMATKTLLALSMLCFIWQVNGDLEGQIRLRGGTNSFEGRVEIYHDNVWGTICDEEWGLNEAQVVCQQLGYPLATLNDRSLEFGPGNGSVWYHFGCDGDEDNLVDCFTEWYWDPEEGAPDNCISHSSDAGVICSPIKEGAIRLFGDTRRFEGGVEYYRNGVWGTVCDHGWSGNDAKVACRQLGYPKARYAITNAWQYYGFPRAYYVLEDVGCDGYENYIKDCWPLDYTPEYCDKYDLAGVYCYENEDDDGDGMSPEAIAGVVVASIFILLIFMCVCAAVCSSKKKKRNAMTYGRSNQMQVNAVYDVASDRAHFGAYPYPSSPGGTAGENTTPFTPPAGYIPGYTPPGADSPPAYDTLDPLPTTATSNTEQPPQMPTPASAEQPPPLPTMSTHPAVVAAAPTYEAPAYEVPVTVS